MPWREPQIVHGAGSLRELPKHLKANDIDNVLLVTDDFLAKTEHFQNIKKYLEEAGLRYSVYDKTIPNPPRWLATFAAEFARRRFVIAHFSTENV